MTIVVSPRSNRLCTHTMACCSWHHACLYTLGDIKSMLLLFRTRFFCGVCLIPFSLLQPTQKSV